MKKLMLIAVLMITGSMSVQAQFLKFGVKAGANFANLNGDGDANFDSYTSFHFGVLTQINVSDNFAIQPELLYSSQGAKVNQQAFEDIKYDYITVPFLLKYYILSNKLSLEAGPQFAFLVNDNVGETFRTEAFEFAAVGGLGVDITKSIFVQARYVAGLTDTSKDAKIKNEVVQLSLGFKF